MGVLYNILAIQLKNKNGEKDSMYECTFYAVWCCMGDRGCNGVCGGNGWECVKQMLNK